MTNENLDVWQIDEAGLLVGSLLAISFQRYPLPSDGVLMSPSPSFGILPIGCTRSGQLVLPIASGEAFWMGFSNREESIPIAIGVEVSTATQEVLNAFLGTDWRDRSGSDILVPPTRALDGIVRLAGGWWPLTRFNPNSEAPQCYAIQVMMTQQITPRSSDSDRAITVRIELIDMAHFAESTGLRSPPPLDLTAAYGGWLLP